MLLDAPTLSLAEKDIGMESAEKTQMKNQRWWTPISRITTKVTEMACVGARASSVFKTFRRYIGFDLGVNKYPENEPSKQEAPGEDGCKLGVAHRLLVAGDPEGAEVGTEEFLKEMENMSSSCLKIRNIVTL